MKDLLPSTQLVNRYRLIGDGLGQLFHLGQNIDLQMIRT